MSNSTELRGGMPGDGEQVSPGYTNNQLDRMMIHPKSSGSYVGQDMSTFQMQGEIAHLFRPAEYTVVHEGSYPINRLHANDVIDILDTGGNHCRLRVIRPASLMLQALPHINHGPMFVEMIGVDPEFFLTEIGENNLFRLFGSRLVGVSRKNEIVPEMELSIADAREQNLMQRYVIAEAHFSRPQPYGYEILTEAKLNLSPVVPSLSPAFQSLVEEQARFNQAVPNQTSEPGEIRLNNRKLSYTIQELANGYQGQLLELFDQTEPLRLQHLVCADGRELYVFINKAVSLFASNDPEIDGIVKIKVKNPDPSNELFEHLIVILKNEKLVSIHPDIRDYVAFTKGGPERVEKTMREMLNSDEIQVICENDVCHLSVDVDGERIIDETFSLSQANEMTKMAQLLHRHNEKMANPGKLKRLMKSIRAKFKRSSAE